MESIRPSDLPLTWLRWVPNATPCVATSTNAWQHSDPEEFDKNCQTNSLELNQTAYSAFCSVVAIENKAVGRYGCAR